MVTALDTVDNDFLDEPATVVEPYETLAQTNQRWRLELSQRPTVNLRPRLAADPQAATQPMAVVR